MPALLLQRLQDHNLQCRGTDPPVAVRQEALAEVGAQYRVLGRTQIDRSADAGQRLPGVVEGAVAAPGALEEEVQPVLVEDVEGIRAAGGAELLESHPWCGPSRDPWVVKHPDRRLRNPIEVPA